MDRCPRPPTLKFYLIDFTIVGFTIFIVVKFFNSLKKKSEDITEKSIETPKQIVLLTEIRDLLENNKGIPKDQN